MTTELLMQYDDAYTEMGDIASARARQYADRHGYALHVGRGLPSGWPLAWMKEHLINERLSMNTADYLYWMDADSLILDLDCPLEKLRGPEHTMIDLPTDVTGICTGGLGVVNCLWSKRLFSTWLFLGPVSPLPNGVDGNPGGDQAPLMLMDSYFPSVRDRIHRVPQEFISNPQSKAKGQFLHMWWARTSDKKDVVRQMRELLK